MAWIEICAGRLGEDKAYRLFVWGEIGPREIGRLIDLLRLQQSFLEPDLEPTLDQVAEPRDD